MESAFRWKLRQEDLKIGEEEMDLHQVMLHNKENINALILKRVKSCGSILGTDRTNGEPSQFVLFSW